jgi:hypothetical protein
VQLVERPQIAMAGLLGINSSGSERIVNPLYYRPISVVALDHCFESVILAPSHRQLHQLRGLEETDAWPACRGRVASTPLGSLLSTSRRSPDLAAHAQGDLI